MKCKKLLSFDSPPHAAPVRPNTLNFNNNNSIFNQNFSGFNSSSDPYMNNSLNSTLTTSMKHSQSDYNALRNASLIETAENMASASKTSKSNFTTSHTMENLRSDAFNEDNSFLNASDVFNAHKTRNISYPSLYPHVEIVNNNQIYSRSPPSSPIQQTSPTLSSFVPYAPLKPLTPQDNVKICNNYNNNNNNQYYNNTNTNNNNNSSYMMSSSYSSTLGNATATNSFGPNYSHALSASLASTPGVTIMPLNSQTSSTSNLFNYGFYDSNNDTNNTQCKLEVSTHN